jgi:hypothetical protein
VIDGERRYDNLEVLNFMKWAGHAGRDTTYEQNVITSRILAGCPERPQAGADGGRYDPNVIDVVFKYQFLHDPERVGPIVLPIPYEDAFQTNISWQIERLDGFTAETWATQARVNLKPKTVEGSVLSVDLRTRFTVHRQWFDIDPAALEAIPKDPALERYLRPQEIGMVAVTDQIKALATEIAAAAPNKWDALQRLWDYFFARFQPGWVHGDQLGSDPMGFVFEHGWFDCMSGSALFVATARALGIPARIVGGYLLYDAVPQPHYWLETYLPPYGWVASDLVSWFLSKGKLEDATWSRSFLAKLDHRMKFHCFPKVLSTMTGVVLPANRQSTSELTETGSKFVSTDGESGRYLGSVEVSMERLRDAPPLANSVQKYPAP